MKRPNAKFAKKLTMKELKHIKETSANNRITLTTIKENIAFQLKENIICHECRAIARKLNLLPAEA